VIIPLLSPRSGHQHHQAISHHNCVLLILDFIGTLHLKMSSVCRSKVTLKNCAQQNGENSPYYYEEDSGTGGFESTNFSNGSRSCSAILNRVLLKQTATQTNDGQKDEDRATTTLSSPLQLGITVTTSALPQVHELCKRPSYKLLGPVICLWVT